jgi:hypothetical protein
MHNSLFTLEYTTDVFSFRLLPPFAGHLVGALEVPLGEGAVGVSFFTGWVNGIGITSEQGELAQGPVQVK